MGAVYKAQNSSLPASLLPAPNNNTLITQELSDISNIVVVRILMLFEGNSPKC